MYIPYDSSAEDYWDVVTAAHRLDGMLEDEFGVGVKVFVPPGDQNEVLMQPSMP